MKHFLIYLSIFGLIGCWTIRGAGQGDQVVVVYNTRVPESKGVAEHYAALRDVPPSQVLGFDMPEVEAINRGDFRDRIQKPLIKALENQDLIHFGSHIIPATSGQPQRIEWKVTRARIRYVVLCYGVPLRIGEDSNLREEGEEKMQVELRRNEAAVDSELTCIPIPGQKMLLAGPLTNPLYGCTNAQLLDPTNGILMVTRLDGPTAAIARGLVDKAIQAETDGLWGRAYFDMRGVTNGPFKIGDDWIRGASEVSRLMGYETIVDTNGGTFPASFPLSQVALYAGWYEENVSGPFARATVEFMPGAFAYHLHSFSAATLRSTTRQWAGPLLARGVTATMGTVAEPYLVGTPDIATFFARFIYSGFSFGEAACAAQHYISWQTTVIGDPLYHPFARAPQAQHEALDRRHSKLIEWSYLRLLDLSLAKGMPIDKAVAGLESLPETPKSAVLEEKLAELYSAQGKPDSSVDALQKALKLDLTPQQQTRLMLNLADRLPSLNRHQETYAVYQQFLKDFPDYPDLLMVYKRLLDLAHHLGQTADAEKYQHEIDWLASPPGGPPKGPTVRRGL
jgi:uncharacterized protein (TIGR03790 family)